MTSDDSPLLFCPTFCRKQLIFRHSSCLVIETHRETTLFVVFSGHIFESSDPPRHTHHFPSSLFPPPPSICHHRWIIVFAMSCLAFKLVKRWQALKRGGSGATSAVAVMLMGGAGARGVGEGEGGFGMAMGREGSSSFHGHQSLPPPTAPMSTQFVPSSTSLPPATSLSLPP